MARTEFDRAINASDLQEWIMEVFPDWCEGDIRLIYDHIDDMPTVTINDHPEEIKDTNCNHNADDSKKVSSSCGHENDLIHREDALSCFHDWIDQRGDVHTADEMPEYQRIEQLTSAQPKRTDERTETHACDCISRQSAIEAYGDWYVEEGTEEGFIGTVKQLLEGLPSAQPDLSGYSDKLWRNAYERGKRDAQSESCRGCKHEPRCSHEEPCGSCSNNYVNKYEGR